MDIAGLDISIESGGSESQPDDRKKKKKAATSSKDILVGAHLRLKQGTRYGLIGPNGSGKSSESRKRLSASFSPSNPRHLKAILASISRGLIPGFSRDMRISSLEQHDEGGPADKEQKTTLEYVVQWDDGRTETLKDLAGKSTETMTSLNLAPDMSQFFQGP